MVDFLVQLVPTLIILGVLIFVHELGHFLACRFVGVGVDKFSIGFGPELITWKGKNTNYVIAAIPFGGYVKPHGESQEEIEARGGQIEASDYLAASKWGRLLILAAGVAMNFALAYVLFVWVFLVGRLVVTATVGGFVEGMPAEASELREGDEITQVNGVEIGDWNEFTQAVRRSDGSEFDFTVNRAGEVFHVKITPVLDEGRDVFGQIAKVPQVGIVRGENYRTERYPIGTALVKAAQREWELIALTYEALWRLVSGRLSPKTIMGPIGIVSVTGAVTKLGLAMVLQFVALLSVSLGVINLLPIPALDGGHIFFLAIETVRRQPVSHAILDRVNQFGFYFLMVIMLLVVFNDLANLDAFEKVKLLFGK